MRRRGVGLVGIQISSTEVTTTTGIRVAASMTTAATAVITSTTSEAGTPLLPLLLLGRGEGAAAAAVGMGGMDTSSSRLLPPRSFRSREGQIPPPPLPPPPRLAATIMAVTETPGEADLVTSLAGWSTDYYMMYDMMTEAKVSENLQLRTRLPVCLLCVILPNKFTQCIVCSWPLINYNTMIQVLHQLCEPNCCLRIILNISNGTHKNELLSSLFHAYIYICCCAIIHQS
jgi:hypothetical protein